MSLRRRKRERSGIRDGDGPLYCQSHRQFVKGHPCLSCGIERDIEAAHIRAGTDGSMAKKPSDCWCVPLCKPCHTVQHGSTTKQAGEHEFWQIVHHRGIDYAKDIARDLARQSKAWQRALKRREER